MPDEKKIVDPEGLSAVIDKLRIRCLSQTEGIAIYEMLSVLADAVVYPTEAVALPPSGWVQDESGGTELYYDVPSAVTAADGVDVILDDDMHAAAQACGLSPTVRTYNGYMRFRAVSVPETEITGHYRILRGPQQEE